MARGDTRAVRARVGDASPAGGVAAAVCATPLEAARFRAAARAGG